MSERTQFILGFAVFVALVWLIPWEGLFTQPSLSGATVASVYIYGNLTNHTCSVVLEDGWNLVSAPCRPANYSRAIAFASLDGAYTSIRSYEGGDSDDPWKAQIPGLPSWVINDLTTVSEQNGYWVYLNTSDTWTFNGTLTTPSFVNLENGWNLMGYPSLPDRNISTALSSIDGQYQEVYLYNATDDTYRFYNATIDNGTLLIIMPYYGYWTLMNDSDTLVLGS